MTSKDKGGGKKRKRAEKKGKKQANLNSFFGKKKLTELGTRVLQQVSPNVGKAAKKLKIDSIGSRTIDMTGL